MLSNLPSSPDAFSRVTGALARTLEIHGALQLSAPLRFRSFLLDECGSDYRPLADLLLDVGTSVRARLAQGEHTLAWESRRAPLVHFLVATRFLQPDVARWAVDAWGAALGIAPRDVSQPILLYADPLPFTRVPDRLQAPTSALRSWPGIHGAARAIASVPAQRQIQSTLSASQQRGRSHVKFRSTILSGRGWQSASISPVKLARFQRVERVAVIILACTAVVVFGALTSALSNRGSLFGKAKADALRDSAYRAQRVLRVIAADSTAIAVDPSTTHEIAMVSESASVAHTVDSLALSGASLIERGVAGRYRVEQRVRSVDGSQSCEYVAHALASGRRTVEVITHTPGTRAFSMTSRSVNGTITDGGYFDVGPHEGMTNGITWRFQMRGRFLRDGFIGESETMTEAILGWRHSQTCLTVADLVAHRVPE